VHLLDVLARRRDAGLDGAAGLEGLAAALAADLVVTLVRLMETP